MATRPTIDPLAPPDRAEFWRWVRDSIRPLLGWVLTGLGLLCLLIAWIGVSGTPLVAKQIPYLVSGGLLGVALITLGGRAFLIEDLRRDAGRLDRLETMMLELHTTLLKRADAPSFDPALLQATANGNGSNGHSGLVALPGGVSFHKPGCPMLAGKDAAVSVTPDAAAKRGLVPCPLCEPATVDA
jgi:hypothetical protein